MILNLWITDPLGNVMEKISNAGTVYKESKYYYWEPTAGMAGLSWVSCVTCSLYNTIQKLSGFALPITILRWLT